MNIIQLQPGDIFMVAGIEKQSACARIRDDLRTILPKDVQILVSGEQTSILRRPDPDATDAYLEARRAGLLNGKHPEGPPDSVGPPPSAIPSAPEIIIALERIAADFHCPVAEALEQFNRLAPEYPGQTRALLDATRLAVRVAMEKRQAADFHRERDEADATALLIQHRLPDGNPIPSDEIRTAIMEAKLTAGDDDITIFQALEGIIRHRGYLPPAARDLTDSELDSELVELAIGLPVTLDRLRQQAGNVGRLTGTPVTNRDRLAAVRALHGLSTDH